MKPASKSRILLGATRSKGKMFEYDVPVEHHIQLTTNPARLFPVAIAILGDFAEQIINSREEDNFNISENKNLLFTAHFFEAYYLSNIDHSTDQYLRSLIAATYYLCSLPGSALVYSKNLVINFEDYAFESFLNYFFLAKLSESDLNECESVNPLIAKVIKNYSLFLKTGKGKEKILKDFQQLRDITYKNSTPSNVLLIDLTFAIAKIKISNSVWTALPASSGISTDKWKNTFLKKSFIKELWPSQKILANEGVFTGSSATIQMPTSAGKTKSTEIILRSFFFKNESQSAVLVAPFKALCHEISDSLKDCFKGEEIKVNEFTDVFQKDFAESENKGLQVIVTTPEKLVYILRQDPELSESIGLIVLDEGHQFDSGTRGVTYELLITSLRQMLSPNAQWVLISAVLSNAEKINDWINKGKGKVISSPFLSPTEKTIGFVNWSKPLGRIEYVKNPNINESDFWVPRIIKSTPLNKKSNREKDRFFPDKKSGGSIAVHLGLKLFRNGCVAIFCGTKSTAINTCKTLNEIHARGYETEYPIERSNKNELDKIYKLYQLHLGKDSPESTVTKLGVLTHHASIPHGLRLCVEYALREGDAHFVICTSTLAQGVNLPIRYLIFTNIYLAGEKLSVRDFHNLVGRAGRSGMHTEGTILFSNPEVYEKRHTFQDKWRWELIEEILKPENSEPCSSSLLKVFDKIKNNPPKKRLETTIDYPTIELLRSMVADSNYRHQLAAMLVESYGDQYFDIKTVTRQLAYKEKVINSIEGFLLSNFSNTDTINEESIQDLAKETLAFYLGNEEEKVWVVELFKIISKSLPQKVPSSNKRTTYSKTLLGINENLTIESWIKQNWLVIWENYESSENLLQTLWPLVYQLLPQGPLSKLTLAEAPLIIALRWIRGESYYEILRYLKGINCKINAGTQQRTLTIQHIVDICEGSIAFDGMLILGAIIEIILSFDDDKSPADMLISDTILPDNLKHLQKSLKYGIPSKEDFYFYERGFADRIVAQELGSIFRFKNQKITPKSITNSLVEIKNTVNKYPRYFSSQMQILVDSINIKN